MPVLRNCYFPENQLGASLKQDGALLRDLLVRDFPENQLGASLKLDFPELDSGQFGDFPENQLGASLKQILDRLMGHGLVELPREPTRGLIEARAGTGSARRRDRTSPRTNSGPH